jgi:hypothetical protein
VNAADRAMPEPTMTVAEAAARLREKAADLDRERHASFERCDTDGALSQWAADINAREARLQADLIERGGLAEFTALFDLDGNWVRAKRINGRYGDCWMLLDEDGEPTGEFAPFRPARKATLEKRGYREGKVLRTAKAAVGSNGSLVSTYVYARPTKPAHIPPDVILDNGTTAAD